MARNGGFLTLLRVLLMVHDMIVKCPRCGAKQDPEHPNCIHMVGRKGGLAAKQVVQARYGKEHYRRAGIASGAARRARAQKIA